MYRHSKMMNLLNEFPDLHTKLTKVEGGEYGSCETYNDLFCYSGHLIEIPVKRSDLTFTTIWSDSGKNHPEEDHVTLLSLRGIETVGALIAN